MRWTDLERLLNPVWRALSIVASLAIVGYAIPRGLDLTDESLYVLLAQTDAPRSLSVIHTQLLFKGLEGLTGITVGRRGQPGTQARGLRRPVQHTRASQQQQLQSSASIATTTTDTQQQEREW